MSLIQIKKKKRNNLSIFLRAIVYVSAGITLISLGFLILYILIKGIPNLKFSLFEWEYNSTNVSLMPALINTVLITIIALILAIPCGIGSAIYLCEYAKKGSKLTSIIRITAETLQGIPSIVYGLFGSLFFVLRLKMGLSLMAGSLTLAIMILPLILRTTEEALLMVPDSYRQASYGLGAGKLRTIFKVVLPSAINGIIAGIILGIGRIVGESAALIYTAGTLSEVAKSVFSSARTLAVHMYVLSGEGFHISETYATAVVLLVIVALINGISTLVAKRIGKGKGNE